MSPPSSPCVRIIVSRDLVSIVLGRLPWIVKHAS